MLVGLVIAQLALLVTIGCITAARFHFMAPIDEENHFSYIQQIAQHGSLPVLGKTYNSLQGLAMTQGRYPLPTTINPKTDGLWGLTYEAFQPPLYYTSAVPAFDLFPNYIDKLYAVRAYDVLLLLGSVLAIGRLARKTLRDGWLIGWSMTLVFFLLPGVVVRFVTVSPLALAVPLAILFVTELWVAWERHSVRRLALAGGLLGLCVLTQLELLALAPAFAVVAIAEGWRRWHHRSLRPVFIALVIPVVLTLPWFAFNEAHYHMLTAGSIAIKEQTFVINPQHLHFAVRTLPGDTVLDILDPTLPAEWGGVLQGHPVQSYLDQLLLVMLIPGALLFIVSLGRRLWSVRAGILGLPWLFNVFELWYIRYREQWAIFARYTYPTLPVLLLLATCAAISALRNRAVLVVAALGGTLSVGAIWIYLIVSYLWAGKIWV